MPTGDPDPSKSEDARPTSTELHFHAAGSATRTYRDLLALASFPFSSQEVRLKRWFGGASHVFKSLVWDTSAGSTGACYGFFPPTR